MSFALGVDIIVRGEHVIEAVRQLPPTGLARSSDEPSHPIELRLAVEAQEAIAVGSGSSGSTAVVGDGFTSTAIGRHYDAMQKRLDSGRAHLQPAKKSHELSAEEEKVLEEENAKFSVKLASMTSGCKR